MTAPAFQIEVVRTDRKRSVSIELRGEVVRVRVPKTLPEERIRELIEKRTPWIHAKLKERAQLPVVTPKEYISGEAFAFLGRNYRLKVLKGEGAPAVTMQGNYLVAAVSAADPAPQRTVRAHLHAWYREQAWQRLEGKTARYAKIIGVSPAAVVVGDYKSRWGACSARGRISYNWKIILAPHRIVDYVVIHELCHLLEHNHSPNYWRHVERHAPHWRECRHWLKTNPLVV